MAAQAAHVRAATNAVGGVLLSVAGAGELLGAVDIPGDTSDNDAAAE